MLPLVGRNASIRVPVPLGRTPLTHMGDTERDDVGSDSLGSSPRAGVTLGTDLLSLGEPRAPSPCGNKGGFSDSGLASCVHHTLHICTRDGPWPCGLRGDSGVTGHCFLSVNS